MKEIRNSKQTPEERAKRFRWEAGDIEAVEPTPESKARDEKMAEAMEEARLTCDDIFNNPKLYDDLIDKINENE